MYTTAVRLAGKSLSPSSKQWLSRHFDDPYVRQRLSHPAQYRSRSAFKLLEVDDCYRRFLRAPDVRAVVDLGAAPGGWSQVVAGFMGAYKATPGPDDGRWGLGLNAPGEHWSEDAKDINVGAEGRGVVIAVDRLRIAPIPGVHTLQADFLAPETAPMVEAIIRAKANRDGKADVILSDMAANATGNRTHDTQDSLDICHAVWDFTRKHLRTAQSIGRKSGGVLLLKHFEHPELQQFRKFYLAPNFHTVLYIKPDSSRSASREGYWLCFGFKG
ncbi:23S ribosomal RNA methyltransferase [Multifurca ochricompacta]|uniref:rRNA methyltransferase 2, mitochondrial n=1 Tax=Multifurca ochricompacta TaxID=376703 RepID=A0AAD4LXK1_9AGAM|nr:23S ribosomal RNA methyltransferase [Multifurca ochricompacta]